MLNLDIILRTYETELRPSVKRIAPKPEMVRRCVKSLKESVRQSKLNARLHVVENLGNAESLKRCFELGLEVGRELILFAEDDWLFYPSAISEMVRDWEVLTQKVQSAVAIYPYDDPDRYDRDGAVMQSRILRGNKRPYRTTEFSTQTFLIHKVSFLQKWALFMGSTETGEEEEGTNKVWRNGVTLFSPIPSYAIHMQNTNPEIFQDWYTLWRQQEKIIDIKVLKATKLNLGCGEDILQGYDNIDIREMPGAIKADVRDLPYEKESIEEIRAIDVYEHIPHGESEILLGHWVSLLRSGGKLIIQTPDLDVIINWIKEAKNAREIAVRIKFLYGAQDYLENYHYTVGQKDLLDFYLRRSGIEGEINIETRDTNLYVEAIK